MGAIDESEIFSASRVQAVANKCTDKVHKSVKLATDERCWPTFEVCVDRGREKCPYFTVVALHEDMAARRALEKVKFDGHVISILCIHPGNSVKVS